MKHPIRRASLSEKQGGFFGCNHPALKGTPPKNRRGNLKIFNFYELLPFRGWGQSEIVNPICRGERNQVVPRPLSLVPFFLSLPSKFLYYV